MMTIERIRELEAAAKEIRKLTIDEIGFLGVGHIGGAMSIVEAPRLPVWRGDARSTRPGRGTRTATG